MFKKLQLVVLGVVVLQAAGMSAMENKDQNSPRKMSNSPKTPRTPRNILSCSQEARRDSGDFVVVTGLKCSLEQRKEGHNNTSHAYYPWPGGNPEFYCSSTNVADQMKPWFPHY